MSGQVPGDAAERLVARDPSRSVIVQAPAGSGKTELLMQRYLALLACVDEPEEILAVTFTRKAAAEMRERILRALSPPPSGATDERLPETAELADAALARGESRGWQLLEFPGRLRIRTLDSVNSWLVESAPLAGTGAAEGRVTEHSEDLYRQAALRTLELVTDSSALAASVARVLAHLDNQADRFVGLLAQMLGRRDQWLPLIGSGVIGPEAREALERSLRDLVELQLRQTDAMLSATDRAELCTLLRFAASQLRAAKPDAPVCAWLDRADFPPPVAEALPHWQALADFLLLSGKAEFRVSVNKATGFPTPKDGGDAALTAQAKALLEELAARPRLAEALDAVRQLPEPVYSDAQWQVLDALIRVLPVLAAQLIVVFREQGETDYMQIAADALRALEDETGPTDLALRLDYQISHILIDEFQDTSRAQADLLERLIAGWSPGDGRTLFVVGDPMQSIYRFRQAEVAIFMQFWTGGVSNLQLEPVRLATNFRSAPAIVEWVNATFSALLPAADDPATGAVSFAPGVAFRPADSVSGVHLHPCEEPARVDEAREIGALVEGVLQKSPEQTIGILVRTRHQARLIVAELRARGIPFAGEGLERSGETAVEQDLIALTRALTHLGDRTAWLALLRAPWCGLSLVDLELLCGSDWNQSVYEQLFDDERLAQLSADGRTRVARLRQRLAVAFARRGSAPFRDWLEGVWQLLGGPAATLDPRGLALAAQFFAVLDQYEKGGTLTEAFLLHERLGDRVDQSGHDARVHLMTVYKAKGLEFDTVILPALDGTTRGDDKPLMAWHRLHNAERANCYLVAPVEATGAESDPVQQLIRRFDREQQRHELDRLLYVATTRARRELHLFFGLGRNKDGEVSTPRQGSLLARLWPVIQARFEDWNGAGGTAEIREDWVQPLIHRFPLDWQPAEAPPGVDPLTAPDMAAQPEQREVTFDWAGTLAQRVGSVVHRCLQYMAERGIDPDQPPVAEGALRSMLLEEGVAPGDLAAAITRAADALERAVSDERARWILSAEHAEASSELALSVASNGRVERMVIDRTFIDASGVRWVIDYKTSSHEGGDLAAFVESEKLRYADQLMRYQRALEQLEPGREVRAALYFPLLGVFAEY